jgi:hypothetical protein
MSLYVYIAMFAVVIACNGCFLAGAIDAYFD